MTTFSVLPFLVALMIGLAGQPLHIYEVNAWNVGTLKVEPWRARASNGIRETTQKIAGALLARMRTLLGNERGEAVIDFKAVKDALEESNRLFHGQFTDINAKIKALEAKGNAVDPILLEVRTKLNEAMEGFSGLNEKFIAQATVVKRLETMGLPANGGDPDRRNFELEARRFNLELRAGLAARGISTPPPEVTVDEYKAYDSAFKVYLRGGKDKCSPDQMRALAVGQDPSGGYIVTPDMTGRMVQKIFESSDMRRFAAIQAISTDALEGTLDIDEASGGWVSETGTRSESNTPQVPIPYRIPVHEVFANPRASQKIVNDASIDIAAWLNAKVANKLTRLQNTAFVTGAGNGRPRGFASYTGSTAVDTSRAWGTPQYVFTGSNGSWGTDPNGIQKLNALMGALKDAYVANAQFFSTRLTKFSIRNLTDASAAGKFVFIPSFQVGVPDNVLGAPINVFQDMVDYTTTDAYALAYGDMRETYLIVDRQGISVLVDPYTAKPYVQFYTTARVGGDMVNSESMKFLKFGTS